MGLFSSDMKEAPRPEIMETPWAPQARGVLTNLMTQDVKHPVRGTAGLSDIEQSGLGQLGQFVSGKSFQDPLTSPYYLGMRRELEREQAEGVSALKRRANMGGMYSSGSAGRVEGDYMADMANKRMSLLGSLYESERSRDNPLVRAQAASQYGGAPRQIEQQAQDAQYQALMQNLLFPYQQQGQIANQLLGYQPWYQPQMYQEPSAMGGIMSMLGPVMSQAGGGILGGLMGGSAGSAGVAGGTGGDPGTLFKGMLVD